MLFLDIRDLFEKLSKHPLQDFFPDFTGGTDYDAACDYLLHCFVKENKYDKRQIYANFITSPGDPQQVKCMRLPLFLYVSFGMLNVLRSYDERCAKYHVATAYRSEIVSITGLALCYFFTIQGFRLVLI
jgi:hypothetical protein